MWKHLWNTWTISLTRALDSRQNGKRENENSNSEKSKMKIENKNEVQRFVPINFFVILPTNTDDSYIYNIKYILLHME